MRCYIANDKDTGYRDVLIPGCSSAAHYGDHACMCYQFINPMGPKGKKKIENEITELEKECEWLKQQLQRSQKNVHKLQMENAILQKQGMPILLRRRLDEDPQKLWLLAHNACIEKNPNFHWTDIEKRT